MRRREPQGRSGRMVNLVKLMILLGAVVVCASVLPGKWMTAFWVIVALIGGLFSLCLCLLLGFIWLFSILFPPPKPRGVRLDQTTYRARVDALLALPALTLEYPGAVLLATVDSKTGRHSYDPDASATAAAIWARIRATPAPSSPAWQHPFAAWKARYQQRMQRGFSGYYSGEIGAGAWYGILALPGGQKFPALHADESGSVPRQTVEGHMAAIRRLINQSQEADVSPQTIIAWYDQQLTDQEWKRCPPRPRLSPFEQEQDWRRADAVFSVSVFWPGSAVDFMPDIASAGRYVRVIEVKLKPLEGSWWVRSRER